MLVGQGSRFKAVIFDMDGTLVELKLNITSAKQEILYKLRSEGYSLKGVTVNSPMLDIIKTAESEATEGYKQYVKKVVDKILTKYEIAAALQASLRKGAKEVIKKLADNNFKLGLATNNSKASVNIVLKKNEVFKVFDAIVTRDDVKDLKPSGEMLELILRLLSVKPNQAIFVGDSIHDIAAAKNVGIFSIAITGGVHDKEMLIKNKPDKMIDSLEELTVMLL